MSLYGLQSAVAALIHYPLPMRGDDLDAFLQGFALDESEKKTVEELSVHPELNKYGRELGHNRLDDTLSRLFRLSRFVDSELLADIFWDRYEPEALRSRIHSDNDGRYSYSLGYLNFLQTDAEVRQIFVQETKPFTQDLISFERAELELTRPLADVIPLPEGSSLIQFAGETAFKVVRLEWDIAELITKGTATERPLVLLFVRRAARMGPRMFEITQDMADYLDGEQGKQERKSFDPKWTEDLKTIFSAAR